MDNQKLDLWCIVELFGHQKIAGRRTEQNVAGTNMLRVDVPETASQTAFTRLFGSAAIYAINPVDEATARHFAERLEQKPIQAWDFKEMILKNDQLAMKVLNEPKEEEEEQETRKEEVSNEDEDFELPW